MVTGWVDKDTGNFVPDASLLFKNAFHIHKGHPVEFQVKRKYKRRSEAQNDYYWGYVVTPLADFLGEEPEDMHETLKAAHNSTIKIVMGQEIRVVYSTAEEDTQGFEDYLARVRHWALTFLHFYIPLPNEGGKAHVVEFETLAEPLALTQANTKVKVDE